LATLSSWLITATRSAAGTVLIAGNCWMVVSSPNTSDSTRRVTVSPMRSRIGLTSGQSDADNTGSSSYSRRMS